MAEEQSITPYTGVQRAPTTLREVFAILFRHRRLVVISFLAVLAGVIVGVFLFGIKYRAETEILVKHERTDNVVSADNNQGLQNLDDLARQREINTEMELLGSHDLLAKVVKASGLDKTHGSGFWSKWIPSWGGPDYHTEKAIEKLQKKLKVENIPDSNMIQVRYSSSDPDEAATVLKNLDKFYIAKHVDVYRAPDAANFFEQQTQNYKDQLHKAESELASFDLQQDAAAPQVERDILLKKASEFGGDLDQTRADIARTQQWIDTLEKERAKTPERLPTQQIVGQNPQLMADLKSSLETLEVKRTALLTNYQPSYRPVQEVEKQIAQIKAAIAKEQNAPPQQNTTDANPTYQMIESELTKAKAQLTAQKAKAAAMAPMVQAYSNQAINLDQKSIKQQDLMRNVKTAEQSYLLYLNKQQQARISDALDKSRILNVAVAETAAVPAVPVNSPWLLIFAGGILAFMISMGSAFAADYFDPSFRTPDEVIKYLDIPVLAALPENGHAPAIALPVSEESESKTGKARTFLLWKRGSTEE